MSTRLEEIQAAVRAKQQAGLPVFTTQVDAPKMPTVTGTVTGTVTPPPTTSTIGPTPAPNYTSGTMKSTYSTPTTPTTNYGGTGNPLNEILYSKKQYDAGNKAWAAQNAQQYYSKLDPAESAAVSKMNTQQLTDYINSKNQPAANTGANTGGGTATPTPTYNDYGMNTGFVPAAPAQAPDYTNIMDTIRNSYMADIKSQSLSIQQALDKAIAASQLNVNQNNNQLQEQIRGLTNQKAQLDDAAQQLQNRRGGFYSGGLDYQLGNIAKTTQQATSDAQRDVATRNDAIYANNALLAQQAADTIKQLETAAPDKIRELIRQAINDERSFGLQEGQLTGSYNGSPTLAAQQFQWGQQVDKANLTGMFGGQQTRSAYESDRNFNYNAGQDKIANDAQYGGTYNGNKTVQQQQQEWQNRFNYGKEIGQFGNGQQTLESRNQAFNQHFQLEQFAYSKARDAIADKQWQAKFDYDKQQGGLDYALRKLSEENQAAYQQANIALSQDDNARAWLTYSDKQAETGAAKYSGMSANQIYDVVSKEFQRPVLDEKGRETEQTEIPKDSASKEQMYQRVMGSGLPDGQDTQVLSLLGLTKSEIDALDKKYGVSSGN